jgi:hypothetical protein
MGRLRERFPRLAVAALCAVALALLSFAHRPAGAAQPPDPALAAYLALGGTLDELCTLDEGDEAASLHCPACTLAKALFAVPCIDADGIALAWSTVEALPAPILLPQGHGPRAPPARGPPVLPLI